MIRKVGSNPKEIGFCNFCNFVIFGFSFGAFYFTINAFVNFNKLLKAGETLLLVIWCENMARWSTDLGFELDQEYIPLNFLQADFHVRSKQHLSFWDTLPCYDLVR